MQRQQISKSLMPNGLSNQRTMTLHMDKTLTMRTANLVMPPRPGRVPAVGLPTLDRALDDRAMAGYLQPLLTPLLGHERPLLVLDHELLDYKPSKRGLLSYRVAARGDRTSTTVFGKIYADLNQLNRVAQVMQRLWTDCFAGDPHCGIPQPVGVIPELAMLLYLPAEGQFLDEVLTDTRAAYAMDVTARWLASLHHSSLQTVKYFNLTGEVANLATWATLVGKTYPELADLAQQAQHYLEAQAQQLPPLQQRPIHKDFHYRHVLVEHGVKVIDFDEVRLGDPNFDLAHFCANLHLLAYRRRGTPHGLHALEQRFLEAYARQTGWSLRATPAGNRAKFVYFYLYTCLKIARQLCLGVGPGPVPTGDERRRQAQMILRQGLAAIA